MKRSPLRRKTGLRVKPAERIRAKVRDEVRERSNGRCEATGIAHDCMGGATQLHHIRRRSQGGKHEAEYTLDIVRAFAGGFEVAGGVSLRNAKRIASTGIDMISIGALTHSAKAIDFSLEIVK